MEVDWTQAWQVGVIGFGLVFAVLIILALAMWLTGRLLSKMGGSADTDEKSQETEVGNSDSSTYED
jgi:Na+-transporting methylmalonyl-CoA/oxaloacetate decarboxylase gamma subunit